MQVHRETHREPEAFQAKLAGLPFVTLCITIAEQRAYIVGERPTDADLPEPVRRLKKRAIPIN